MDQWISVLNCYLYGNMIRDYVLQYLFPRGADGKPNREVIDRAIPLMNRDLDAVEKGLAGKDWLAGTFSIADIFYGPCLYSASLFPEGKLAINSRPNVKRLLDRVTDRATFQKVQPK
jgi:glutathione S-transferase